MLTNDLSLAECEYILIRFTEMLERSMESVERSFSLFEDSLIKTTDIIAALDKRMSVFTGNIKLVVATEERSIGHLAGGRQQIGNNIDWANEKYAYTGQVTNKIGEVQGTNANPIMDAIETTKDVYEAAGKIAEGLGGVIPGIKKFGKGFSLISDVLGAFTGIEKLSEIPSGNVSITEGIVAVGEIVAAMGAIRKVGAMLGATGTPWGIAAFAATEIMVQGVSWWQNKQVEERNAQIRQVNDKAARKTFEMSETTADYYVENINKISEQTWRQSQTHEWSLLPTKPGIENTMKFGSNANNVIMLGPRPASDKTRVALSVQTPRDVVNQIPVRGERAEPSFMQRSFTFRSKLEAEGMTNGRIPFQKALAEYTHIARAMDRRFNLHLTEMVQSSGKWAANTLVNNGNFGRQIPNITEAEEGFGNSHYPSNTGGEIDHGYNTINVNAPLIQNFTINVRNVKEGLNDLKHQVEEMLLQILYSAKTMR